MRRRARRAGELAVVHPVPGVPRQPPAAVPGPGVDPGRRPPAGAPTGPGCSSSPAATTATSRTGPTAWPGSRSSCWPSAARPPLQKGPLWWAGQPPGPPPLLRHRPGRPLAPEGVLVEPRRLDPVRQVQAAPTSDRIKDFAAYPELRFLNRHDTFGAVLLAVGCFWLGGWSGLVLGFFVSTILLWHSTFFVNSAGPRHGPAPLRHRGHQPELGPHRRPDHGRGLAQQPPLRPQQLPQRLLLVGVGPDLLRPEGPELARRRARPEGAARTACWPPTACRTAASTSACSGPTGPRPPGRHGGRRAPGRAGPRHRGEPARPQGGPRDPARHLARVGHRLATTIRRGQREVLREA